MCAHVYMLNVLMNQFPWVDKPKQYVLNSSHFAGKKHGPNILVFSLNINNKFYLNFMR